MVGASLFLQGACGVWFFVRRSLPLSRAQPSSPGLAGRLEQGTALTGAAAFRYHMHSLNP